MVKDSGNTNESPVKKRRKDETAKISGTGNSKITSNDTNVYKQVIEYEEGEASERDPENDLKLYNDTCAEFRRLMVEIAETKATSKDQEVITEKRIQAALLFVTLKKLNRLEKFRTKKSRDILHKVKQQVDSQHLHLQNLLYEVLHLKKEVTKCLQFKSKDEEIDLVPVEEFYKEAPESISRHSQTSVDTHQLKLARLEWELKQRKQLAAQCQELHSEKETVATEIQKKRTHLENLAPMLKDILAVTKPVQENLGFSGSAPGHKHPETAYLLPHPLYFLYVQASAYKEAFDNKNMTVDVTGDEEEAQRMRCIVTENQNDQDDSDSDNQEEGGGKRHHRKKSRSDRQEERRKQLLTKHPLSVNISIGLDNGKGVIHLTFWYLINLRIISVKVKVTLVQAQTSLSGGHLVSGENILCGLYSDDYGLDSPNVANYYQLKQVGLDSYNSKDLGLAYLWAQRICGFDFAAADKDGNVEPSSSVSQANLPGVVKAIKKRLSSRIALYHQVQVLENKIIPHNPDLSSRFPGKLNGVIEQWLPYMICSDYVALPYTSHLVPVVSPTESDIYYKVIIGRSQSKLHAAIILKSDYPTSTPVFALQIQLTNNRVYSASNNETMRDMEREVNCHCKEICSSPKLVNWMLTAQLLKLLSCFDIFLEATMGNENTKEKVFLQPVRGKTRSLPYTYVRIGDGIFVH